jgi:DNA polymerase-3 subunit beta
MIRRTVFAAGDDAARYTMKGILWELDGDKVTLVATDGKRLARSEGLATAVGDHATRGQMPVVPTKAMQLLERALQDDPEELIKVCVRPNEVLFRTGRSVIYSRLVEGRFPDYKAVMPKKSNARIHLPIVSFQAAVRQAAIMTDNESKRVTFKFSTDKLTLQSQGSTTGRSRVEMPIEYDGKAIDINFNPEYLTDMLKVLPAEAALTVDLIDGGSPGLFRCGDNYAYLVMPLT